MSKIQEINGNDFEENVLKSDQLVLVDFWAPWCYPCQLMTPILEQVADELKEKIKIVKVNIEDLSNQELAMTYQVDRIPNMKLFKNGKVIKGIVGLNSKENLLAEINNSI